MNKLALLSTAVSLGMIQQDKVLMGIILCLATLIMFTAFSNAQKKK